MSENRSDHAYRKVWLIFLSAIYFSTIAKPALSMSWDNAIEAVETKADELWSLAETRGLQSRFLGTGFNELHVREHSCAILGRMLEKPETIVVAERSTEFNLGQADEHETALAAHSLDNWVHNAKRLKALSRDRRVEEWNLDCVGRFGIPDTEFVARENDDTFFDLRQEGRILQVLGDVDIGFASQLKKALTQNPTVSTVALGSGGGRVMEAIEAGLFIRELGLETTLWNGCYSACTLVFLGGVERKIWSPYPTLHFHQVSSDSGAVPFDHSIYSLIFDYSAAMGADPSAVLKYMYSASPDRFFEPSLDDLCSHRLASWVQRLCWAEATVD